MQSVAASSLHIYNTFILPFKIALQDATIVTLHRRVKESRFDSTMFNDAYNEAMAVLRRQYRLFTSDRVSENGPH